MSNSFILKQQGNHQFQNGHFRAAESFYSEAIVADPKNPALYTNRAMARLKLSDWDSVITDCQTCLSLSSSSMKAHYYLAQAFLFRADYDDALRHALAAHELCVQQNDKSLAAATTVVLRCKKERWEHKEKRRVREAQELERQLLALLAGDRDEMLASAADGDSVEKGAIVDEAERKTAQLKDIFERARGQANRRREVPEWAIDDIGFGFMVDPVITKNGKSYERSSIMEHLRRSPTDPLTREPLYSSDLRPNMALRQACKEFLEENGWAADW